MQYLRNTALVYCSIIPKITKTDKKKKRIKNLHFEQHIQSNITHEMRKANHSISVTYHIFTDLSYDRLKNNSPGRWRKYKTKIEIECISCIRFVINSNRITQKFFAHQRSVCIRMKAKTKIKYRKNSNESILIILLKRN